MENLYFILYIIPIIILNILAYKKKKKIFLIISILLLSLITGLRGMSVGIDTEDYYFSILNNFPRDWQFEEIGFRFISNLLMKIFENATIVIFIFALFTNLLIMLRFWDFKEKCNFSLMSTLYILIYMFSSMNIMRQFLAIAIIFYFTRYLEKKKYYIYIISVIIASLIHKTALLAMIYPIVYIWSSLTKNKKILVIIPLISISIFGMYFIIKYENNHIMNYLSTDRIVNNINLTFIYRLLIFIFSYLIYKFRIKIVYNNKKNNELKNISYEDCVQFKVISVIYFIGLCFAVLGMFYDYAGRISLYCLIFEPVYWGFIVNNGYNKFMNILIIIVYAVYVFLVEIFMNGSGVFPYYWNI